MHVYICKKTFMRVYIAAYIIVLCMYVAKLCKHGYNNTIILPTMQLYYVYSILQHCMMGIYLQNNQVSLLSSILLYIFELVYPCLYS